MLFALPSQAQQKQEINEADYQNTEVSMADKFREEGKIYVVVVILATVLAGLLIYTVLTDRKVTRLEKEMDNFKNKTLKL